jgi:hypothetical protein
MSPPIPNKLFHAIVGLGLTAAGCGGKTVATNVTSRSKLDASMAIADANVADTNLADTNVAEAPALLDGNSAPFPAAHDAAIDVAQQESPPVK